MRDSQRSSVKNSFSAIGERVVAPVRTWSDMSESERFVQFYETNHYLLDAFVFSFLRVSGRGTG
ncbi:MAG: hypothetical protein NVSMB22_20100 [Chloroflexota bacterium]